MIAPLIEEMGGEYEGKAVIGKVDVDSNPNITSKFGVRNIPTVLFLKNGEVVDKQVGACPKQTLVSKLNAQL
jgi:thioredoxin 1